MRRIAASFALILLLAGSAFAAPDFPALTGRVVDSAGILSPSAEATLEQSLADHESRTTNQVVVATLPSLSGLTIEEYGVQLARRWQIGQKDKKNGAVLLIAPNDRAVRIEVGYGLEGVLTDSLSGQIINTIMLPQFKTGNMQQGVLDGTAAVLSVLEGREVALSQNMRHSSGGYSNWIWVIFILFWLLSWRYPALGFLLGSTMRFGGGSRGGGGGFSGGGGGFGGGGASGRW